VLCFAAAVGLGVPLAWGEHRLFRQWEKQRATARADAAVESGIREAREHMGRGRWDLALAALDDAVADENATSLDEARAAREEALAGQAASILEEAERSAAERDPARAVALLRHYQSHPAATRADRARILEQELTLAASDAAAVTLLEGLADDALARVTAGGLPEGGGVIDTGAQAVYRDTLRRNLPAELRRRAQRTARLRTSAAFRDVLAFADAARKRRREETLRAARGEQALAVAFRELGVGDPAEREKLRDEVRQGTGGGEDWAGAVARRRAEAKARSRAAPEAVAGDWAAFDRAVDRELDKLLEDLRLPGPGDAP
jgi:hypothetical protein